MIDLETDTIIKRKIVQLTSCIGLVSSSTGREQVYALCNDGTVWAYDANSFRPRWSRIDITAIVDGE